jgi:hypothetical protein
MVPAFMPLWVLWVVAKIPPLVVARRLSGVTKLLSSRLWIGGILAKTVTISTC